MIAVSIIAALLMLHRQAASPAAGYLCLDGSFRKRTLASVAQIGCQSSAAENWRGTL